VGSAPLGLSYELVARDRSAVPLGRVDQPLWDSTGARTTRSVLRETQTRARAPVFEYVPSPRLTLRCGSSGTSAYGSPGSPRGVPMPGSRWKTAHSRGGPGPTPPG